MDRLRFVFAALVAAFFSLVAQPTFALDGEFPASTLQTTHDPVRLVTLDDRTPGPWHARARESAEFRTVTSWSDYMAKSCAMTASLASSGYTSVLAGWDCSDPIMNWPNPAKGAVIAVPTEPTLVFVPNASESQDGTPTAMVTIPEVAANLATIDKAVAETQAIAAAVEAQTPVQAPDERPDVMTGAIAVAAFLVILVVFLHKTGQNRGTEVPDASPIASDAANELDELHMRYAALRNSMVTARLILEEPIREGRTLSDIRLDAHHALAKALAADLQDDEQREAVSKDSDKIVRPWDLPSAGIS